MQWLLSLAEEYRSHIRGGPFYKALALASDPKGISGWIHQLYHQSRDFTSALSLRYAMCQDPLFQGCFAKHAMEEVDHCEQLIDWMRKHEFLEANETPTDIAPTLETQLVSAYCFRSVLRESYAHQVIALNLISEGVSYDFFSAVNPRLAELGLRVGHYWQVHKEIDQTHLAMGLDLIPKCSPQGSLGKTYAQIAWEMASLYERMLDSWSIISFPNPQGLQSDTIRNLPKAPQSSHNFSI